MLFFYYLTGLVSYPVASMWIFSGTATAALNILFPYIMVRALLLAIARCHLASALLGTRHVRRSQTLRKLRRDLTEGSLSAALSEPVLQWLNRRRTPEAARRVRSAVTNLTMLTTLLGASALSYFMLHQAVFQSHLGAGQAWSTIATFLLPSPEYLAVYGDNGQTIVDRLGTNPSGILLNSDGVSCRPRGEGALYLSKKNRTRPICELMAVVTAVYTAAAAEYGFVQAPTLKECLKESLDSVGDYPTSTLCRQLHILSPNIADFLADVDRQAKAIAGPFSVPNSCVMQRAVALALRLDDSSPLADAQRRLAGPDGECIVLTSAYMQSHNVAKTLQQGLQP